MEILIYCNQFPIVNEKVKILLSKLGAKLLPVISYDSFSYHHKLLALEKYIKEKNDDDLLLVIDGFDVLPVNGATHQILEEAILKTFDLNKITFNSEISCSPSTRYKKYFDHIPTVWKYLNGGIWCSKVKILKPLLYDLLETLPENNLNLHINDQLLWIQKYAKDNSLIDLDYECKIFQSLYRGNSCPNSKLVININKKIFYNPVTQTFPLLVHGNGGVKMDKIFKIIDDKEYTSLLNPEIISIN